MLPPGTDRRKHRCRLLPHSALEASVAGAVSAVIEREGRIDALVNNAGVGIVGAAEGSSVAQAQELFDTNFFGMIRLTRPQSVVEPGYTDTAFDANAADPDSPIECYAVPRGQVKEGLFEAVRAGDDPSVVAKVVLRAATSRTPNLRYPAGPPADIADEVHAGSCAGQKNP
jgi:short subunit dehydrogenase